VAVSKTASIVSSAVLGEHRGERAQAGGARQLAALICQRDPVVVLEHQQDGALDADLLGVGSGESVEGVPRRRHRTS
jgi:hypothetical protein